MTHSASIPGLGSEFEPFLFAPIAEQRNGMPLSVLSALARQDVDPWQEAARLSRLPGPTAIERLATLIAALPDWPSANSDARTIAARLIALLPRRARLNISSLEPSPGARGPANSHIVTIVIYVMFMAILLGTQWTVAGRHPPVQIDNAHAATSGAVSKTMPPQIPGKHD